MIDITIFPMRSFPDGSTTIAEPPIDPEFWDVLVQDEDGEILDEKEDLETYGTAEAAVGLFLLKYPDASVDYR